MSFSSLKLCPALLDAIDTLNYSEPTAVQQAAIAPALAGRDLLATARTGSGKTAAYALPLLQRWHAAADDAKPKTLVLLPTRELALQVSEALKQLAINLNRPKILAVYGGVSINPQLMALRGGADFVVATPGRLLDVIENNAIDLWHTSTLVLDEADRLLDLGFAEELQSLLSELPDSCQTLMFSATIGGKVESLAKRLLNQPLRIELEEAIDTLEQRAIEVDAGRRTELLIQLLDQSETPRALVFCASKIGAEALSQELIQRGLRADALYGGLPQAQREEVLEDLKLGLIDVLVATDLAARGLDVQELPLVVNYDLPRAAPVYTHRIGRTGRAGQQGLAISFIDTDSRAHFKLIEKRVGIKLPREQIAGFEPTDEPNPRLLVSDSNGGIKGKRPSKKDKLRAAAAAEQKREE